MNDSLGNRMKFYESQETFRRLMPGIPAIARIDGRSFSKFTMGMNRPYDERFSNLMIETTRYLVQETNANCGYTQSDEITLTWYTEKQEGEIFFDGRVQKMQSVLSGMTTAFFLYNVSKYLTADYADKLPHFDARVFSVPSLDEGANCFLWREWDATKNSINMAAQEYYSHKELMGINGPQKQEMLWKKGCNWNNYPSFFKRGSYIQRQKTSRKFTTEELEKLPPKHEARRNPDLVIERTDCVRVELPPLGSINNRPGVIYFGEKPV